MLSDKVAPVNIVIDLVNREAWGARALPTGRRLNASSVEHVLIYHTAGSECVASDACIRIVRSMQVIRR